MIKEICKSDLKSRLLKKDKPVILYGMGNGADMIIEELEKMNIEFSDVFASDDFVRGQFFHGKKVLTLSQIEEKYEDFLILMTFAVHDDKTIDFVKNLSLKYEVYSPTVPVVSGKGLFTLDFYNEHEKEFEKAFSLLSDEKSRETFINILSFKLSGKLSFLFNSYSEKSEVYEKLLKLNESESIVDLGAYDGDTIKEFLAFTKEKYETITAFEPDEKNFRKLLKNTENLENITCLNIGAWDKKETLFFEKKAGRNSKQSSAGTFPVNFDSVDNVISHKVSFLKMDIEGAEKNALEGAKETIRRYKPKLYVCAYHRNEDLYELILKINVLSPDYKIYLRQHKYIPAWECNIYACVED